MRQVVSDSGPVLHLAEAGALHLLALAGDVHIPAAVDAEITLGDSSWPTHRPSWMLVESLVGPHDAVAAAWRLAGLLDIGEAEAISLALQIHADWLLSDDAAARLFASALGMEVHGSLGVVLWAAANSPLSPLEAETTLDALADSSLWISARVLAEARAALAQIFRRP